MLYDLTAGQMQIDFYLASSYGESGENNEQRSEIFTFAAPGKREQAASEEQLALPVYS